MITFEQYCGKISGENNTESPLVENDEHLPTITDLYGNEFTPDPNQTIQYLASLMRKNPRLLSRFVREMKRSEDGMGTLLNEHFNHPEFYSVMAKGMVEPEEGRKRCHRLSRAMNDQYMEALDKYVMENKLNEEVQPKADLAFEDGGPMGAPPQNPSGMPPKPKMFKPQGGNMGGGDVEGDTNPKPGGAIGGGSGPQINSPPPGGPMGGGSGSPEGPGMPGSNNANMPPGAANSLVGGPPPMPPGTASGGPPGLDMGNGGVPNQPPQMPKLKGESAHSNMIEEMSGFPHMREFMISHCTGPNCKDKR